MEENIKPKCDRKYCDSKVFRGEHVCDGFDIYQGAVLICPCSCHRGVSREETLELARRIIEGKNMVYDTIES